MRTLLLTLMACLGTFRLQAQESPAATHPPTFYKFLSPDSVVLFYDAGWRLVSPECAYFYRYTKLSPDYFFTGFFRDYSRDSSLVSTGFYQDKEKTGLFQEFYLNGQLKATGQYQHNQRTGRWQTFYDNGQPKYLLRYADQLIYLIAAWEKNGRQTVWNGKGTVIEQLLGGQLTGTVKDSLMEGKWTVTSPAGIAIEETFKRGKLTKGTHLYNKNLEPYRDSSRLPLLRQSRFATPDTFTLHRDCVPYLDMGNITPPVYHQLSNLLADLLAVQVFKTPTVQKAYADGFTYTFRFTVDAAGKVQDLAFTSANETRPEDVLQAIQVTFAAAGSWQPATLAGKPIAQEMILTIKGNAQGITAHYLPKVTGQ